MCLYPTFVSNSYSDIAKAWNEERSRVQEALNQHLIPVGTKWCREWLWEEVKDALAIHCSNKLKEVHWLAFIRSHHSQASVAAARLIVSRLRLAVASPPAWLV